MKKLIEDVTLFSIITLILLSPLVILFAFVLSAYFWSLPMTIFIGLSYSSWMYIDRYADIRGGRASNWLRQSSIWSIVSNYFPIKLVKTEDLDPHHNYIFGYHPHGRLTAGAAINFLTEATHFSTLFPGIRPHLMILRSGFLTPFFREFLLHLGNDNIIHLSSNVLSIVDTCRVSRESCQFFLNGTSGQGNAVVIVIGGMREIYLAEYQTMVFYLRERKGFIRLALENGFVNMQSI